jgi:hypothetical protein
MLDAVADSLEARGLIKEAYEIDKVADAIEPLEQRIVFGYLKKKVAEVYNILSGLVEAGSRAKEASKIDKQDAGKWVWEEKEELEKAKKLEKKVDDIHDMVSKLVKESEKDLEFSKSKSKELSKQ